MTSRIAVLAILVLASCDGDPDEDAGMDAGGDAAADTGVDAPPAICSPTCDVGDSCCDELGETMCFALRNDPTHCGRCDVNCLTENRGDGCAASSCTCGDNDLGCAGMSEDFCCPSVGATAAFCANLDTSASNCGGCGIRCNPLQADRCDGAICRCGDMRGGCAGTPDSMCCQVGVDITCADTTSDTFHCGICNNLCQTGESCQNGSCTTGPACAGGCELGEVCCDGACCTRRSCVAGAGVCSPDFDGGVGDGGVGDGGVGDGGVGDGGVSDAGPADAGPADAGPADAGPADAG